MSSRTYTLYGPPADRAPPGWEAVGSLSGRSDPQYQRDAQSGEETSPHVQTTTTNGGNGHANWQLEGGDMAPGLTATAGPEDGEQPFALVPPSAISPEAIRRRRQMVNPSTGPRVEMRPGSSRAVSSDSESELSEFVPRHDRPRQVRPSDLSALPMGNEDGSRSSNSLRELDGRASVGMSNPMSFASRLERLHAAPPRDTRPVPLDGPHTLSSSVSPAWYLPPNLLSPEMDSDESEEQRASNAR